MPAALRAKHGQENGKEKQLTSGMMLFLSPGTLQEPSGSCQGGQPASPRSAGHQGCLLHPGQVETWPLSSSGRGTQY